MRRHLLTLPMLLILMATAVSAQDDSNPVYTDHRIEGPNDDCDDCFDIMVGAGQTVPKNCADCAAWGAAVGVAHDDAGLHADAVVCRTGFVYICVVEVHETV